MVSKSAISRVERSWTRAVTTPAVLIASFLFFTLSAWGQVALVHVTNCGPGSFPTTCTVTSTGAGNLIVVAFQTNNGSGTAVIGSITDNAGNAYVQATGARATDTTFNVSVDLWYAKNSLPGATSVMITPNTSAQGAVVIWEFSGVDATAPLDQVGALNSQPATTTPSGAPVTVTAPNEVIISAMVSQGSATGMSAGNAFTSDSALNQDGWAHLLTSSVGTYQAKWNSTAGNFASSTASFKASSSALNACDLNADGVDNILDVNRSVSMALALSPCTANINGPDVCNVVTVQRVVNSSLPGGACVVNAVAVTPTALSCNPSNLSAPGTSACTGTLSGAAPSGGLTLALSSNNAIVTVPSSVTAAAGATMFAFTATVGAITTNQTAVLTASANGASPTASLNLTALPQLSTVSCSPTTLASAQTSTCTVTLTSAATSATTVGLSSNVGTLSVPASVTINGAISGTFTATAGTVSSSQTATITASLSGLTKTTTVSLTPTVVSHSVTLTWVASTSPNITGYNIYRGTTSGGPYTKVNSSLISGLSYVDTTVLAGQTYYYVGTAVNSSNAESAYSSQTQGTIPTP